jgi:chromosomal replication initiation ATPase DnaA
MPLPSFPDIGFSCNPFRALTREEWAAAAVIPEAVHRALRPGGNVQILGPAGSGKSTVLLALDDKFLREGRTCAYEYIPPGCRRFRTQTDGLEVFLLDEAQRLSRGVFLLLRERARLARAAASGIRLILGSHEDLRDDFRAERVELASVRLEPPDAEQLAVLLERRLGLFAQRPDRAEFTPDSILWLLKHFGGDLRTMECFLYEFFQIARPDGLIRPGALQDELPSFTPPAVEPRSGSGIWD